MEQRKFRKQVKPTILWKNKIQLAIWEIVLKDEIMTGHWCKAKFDINSYISAQSTIFASYTGTTITPSQLGFNFGSNEFLAIQGYFISIVIKLTQRYDLSIDELKTLSNFAESLVETDFKDDNSDYRRVQVKAFDINDRNITPEYAGDLLNIIKYFRNKGIEMDDVISVLKKQPLTKKQIKKVMNDMSSIIKHKISLDKLRELSKH